MSNYSIKVEIKYLYLRLPTLSETGHKSGIFSQNLCEKITASLSDKLKNKIDTDIWALEEQKEKRKNEA